MEEDQQMVEDLILQEALMINPIREDQAVEEDLVVGVILQKVKNLVEEEIQDQVEVERDLGEIVQDP